MNLPRFARQLRPGDPILVLVLSALAVWGWLGPGAPGRGEAAGPIRVRITSAEAPPLILTADTSRVLPVEGPLGTTLVEVDHGRVRIAASPCPHQFCVRLGVRERPGTPIVCLPNAVMVELIGGPSPVDGTTR